MKTYTIDANNKTWTITAAAHEVLDQLHTGPACVEVTAENRAAVESLKRGRKGWVGPSGRLQLRRKNEEGLYYPLGDREPAQVGDLLVLQCSAVG